MYFFLIIIFWLSILLVASSYFLYPLVIWLIGKMFPFSPKRKEIFPQVSVIIPAYNEKNSIEKKVRNTLELEYPQDKMEILVGSDGSTDKTSEIMSNLSNNKIRFFDFKQNRGKTAVQNDLVKESKGEILVFTDAASFLSPDSLKNIVRNFADHTVGCVGGKMLFVDTESNITTESQGIYWRYESKLRELESRIGSLIGVDGPLYAVKREYYLPLESHIISDLLTPLLVLEQGKRVILESEALVFEDPTHESTQEFKTRRRITVRGLVGLASYARLLNPLRHPFLSFQIFLHKIVRWLVGPLILINLMSTVALSYSEPFRFLLVLYLLFFMGAGSGWIAEHFGVRSQILTIPYYFTLVNLAAMMGVIDFLKKKQAVTWKPVRK